MLVNSLLKLVLFSLFGSYFFSSCKKKMDSISPQIIVESPLPNSNIILPNTVNVKGSSNDNNKLKKVEINIVNSNLTPISSKVTIELNSNIYNFDELFYLDDPILESGSYFISLKAYDEYDNVTSKYVNISLTEIKKVYHGLYFIKSQNENSNIYFIDSNNNVAFENTLIGNIQLSNLNSKHQYLFIASSQNAFSFTLPNFNELWSIYPFQTPYPFFSNLFYDDIMDCLYMVFGDGRIHAYNKQGQIVNSIYTNYQEWFGEIYVDNSFVISEVFSNLLNRFIVVYYKTSGVENHRIQVDGEVAKILKKEDNLFMVAVNYQNNGRIYCYDLNNNSMSTEIEITDCQIYDALIENELLYLATNLGVYTYNLINKSLNLAIDIKPIYGLKREQLDGYFLLNDGKNIYRYNYGDSPSIMYSSSDSISNVMLFYNK